MASAADLKLRRNEKLKASAGILNKAAGTFLAAGVIGPTAGAVMNQAATYATLGVYLGRAVVGLAAAVILRAVASKILDKLEG